MKTYQEGINVFYEKYTTEGPTMVSWEELNEKYVCSAPLVPVHRTRERELDSCHFDAIREDAIRFIVPGAASYPCVYINILDREALAISSGILDVLEVREAAK